jgi:hypothetical protein
MSDNHNALSRRYCRCYACFCDAATER